MNGNASQLPTVVVTTLTKGNKWATRVKESVKNAPLVITINWGSIAHDGFPSWSKQHRAITTIHIILSSGTGRKREQENKPEVHRGRWVEG
jgi:hypothetical protein